MQPAGPDPCKIASPSRSRVRLQSGDGNPAETVAQFALGRWGLNIEHRKRDIARVHSKANTATSRKEPYLGYQAKHGSRHVWSMELRLALRKAHM